MKITVSLLVVALLAACPKPVVKTTAGENRDIANNAPPPPPPPPTGGTPAAERKLSTEAKADYKAAADFYVEQEKGGWTPEKCQSVAAKFEQVAGTHTKLVEAHFAAGVAYQKCGDLKKAEDKYQKVLQIDSGNAAAMANLGSIYYTGGNLKRAKEYFEAAVKADPKNVAGHNNLAWLLYLDMKKAPDAKAKALVEREAQLHLQTVLAVNSDNVVAYTILALMFMEGAEKNKSRLDIANLLLEEGKKRHPEYPLLWNTAGLLQLKKGNVSKSLDNFKKAVELDPKLIEARMNLAQIILSFRKYEEAGENFREVLKLDPKNYDALVALGVALRGEAAKPTQMPNVRKEKIDEAVVQYDAAIALDPKRPDAYYNKALLWKDYTPNDPDMAKNIEQYKVAKGIFDKYIGLAKTATPTAAEIDEAKGHMEDCDKYVAALTQAIQIMQQNPPPPPPPPPTPTPTPASGPATAPTAGNP